MSCVQLSTVVQVSEATPDYTHDGYRGGGGARMSVVHVYVVAWVVVVYGICIHPRVFM